MLVSHQRKSIILFLITEKIVILISNYSKHNKNLQNFLQTQENRFSNVIMKSREDHLFAGTSILYMVSPSSSVPSSSKCFSFLCIAFSVVYIFHKCINSIENQQHNAWIKKTCWREETHTTIQITLIPPECYRSE